MENIKTLIDKATKICGSTNALAERMGVKPNVISMLRGGRQITPETAAELADIAGEDAREAAIQAIIERAKGTRREGALKEILGKGLAAGVAGLLVFSYSPEPKEVISSASFNDVRVNSLYIVEYFKRTIRRIQSFLKMSTAMKIAR